MIVLAVSLLLLRAHRVAGSERLGESCFFFFFSYLENSKIALCSEIQFWRCRHASIRLVTYINCEFLVLAWSVYVFLSPVII